MGGAIKADRSLCYSTFPGELIEKQNSDGGKQRNKATIILLSCFQANIPNSPLYITSDSPHLLPDVENLRGLLYLVIMKWQRWLDYYKESKMSPWKHLWCMGYSSKPGILSKWIRIPQSESCISWNPYMYWKRFKLLVLGAWYLVIHCFLLLPAGICWSLPGSHKFFNHWPKVSTVGELYAVNCRACWLDFLEVVGLFHHSTEYQPKMLPDMMVSEVGDSDSGSFPDLPEPPPYYFHYAI